MKLNPILCLSILCAGTALHAQLASFFEARHEAEDAKLSNGAFIEKVHPGYSGTAYAGGFYKNEGATASFSVNAPDSGEYTLSLRYSAKTAPSNFSLNVNGKKVKVLDPKATGKWTTWGTYSTPVSLKAGKNSISIRSETSTPSCINLDYIELTDG